MSNKLNETFKKHLKLLHEHLNEIGDPENDTISARLDNWLDQNSSGYTSSFKVDAVVKGLNIKKGTPAFNELVDAFKERSFELNGNQFVKTTKKGSGVSDEVVKDTANQYIKHFGKGSYSLENSAKDFASLSQGGGDPDVRSNFPNWSDKNFKQVLDILYTDGGLKRPVDEVTTEGNESSGLKQLVPITLKGATVIDVMTSSDGKVHLRLKGSNSTQLYDAILV
jgi:hypothetical protein